MKEKLRRRRVLIEIETALAPGRDMVRGIAKFVREISRWDIHHDPGAWSLHGGTQGPSSMEQQPVAEDTDGIITRIYDEASEKAAHEAIARGISVVDVLGEVAACDVPLVHTDDEAVAKMALDYFHGQGFRRFAFCGLADTRWSLRRGEAFSAGAAKREGSVESLVLTKTANVVLRSDAERVKAWLEGLPKPVAIFVSCDHIAPLVLEGCSRLGITVPEQVAVLGVNNDTVACNVCNPTLSSIDAGHYEIGYRAARLLEELMDGGEPPEKPIFVEPRRLIVRESSGQEVIIDPQIARAARFINKNAVSPIGVDDVAASVSLSRRELQRRFRDVTGRTVHSAILAARLGISEKLLETSDYTIDAVAEKAGFGSRQHFAKTFRQHAGVSPAAFRKKKKLG
jgi:LacI family transcriptional regulator